MYLTGEFEAKNATIQAIRELVASGFPPADFDIFSDEPLEFPRDVLDRPSRMSFGVVCGAITLGLLTIGFVYFTQYNYPLITGGMPLFSFWATGVIFYELTMLGAILTSFFWFLGESGLLRKSHRKAPVPALAPGTICVRVHCRPEQTEAVTRSLERAGATRVAQIGDAA